MEHKHAENDLGFWDRLGIGLSLLCAIHCIVTAMLIMALPILARYYLTHPYFHILLAVFIVPVGVYAFWTGFRRHHKKSVLALGSIGLFIVGILPTIVHGLTLREITAHEPIWISVGSVLLVWAHLLNRKSCQTCAIHSTR